MPTDDYSPLVTSLRFQEGTGSLEVSFSILSTCASEFIRPSWLISSGVKAEKGRERQFCLSSSTQRREQRAMKLRSDEQRFRWDELERDRTLHWSKVEELEKGRVGEKQLLETRRGLNGRRCFPCRLFFLCKDRSDRQNCHRSGSAFLLR